MADMHVFLGERGVVYPFQAIGADGSVKDITGYTVKLYIYDDSDFTNMDEARDGTLIDPANGLYQYTSKSDGTDWDGAKKSERLARWLWQNSPNNPTVRIWSEEFRVVYHRTPPIPS